MRIFLLSDPHFGRDMSRFGEVWIDHERQIQRLWERQVSSGDLVLVPGDISWATTTKAIEKHLDVFNTLPGRVLMSPGNHDRWWKKRERLRYSEIRFLADEHLLLSEDWVIAATMGWESPESPWWKEAQMREDFEAACHNLEATLEAAHRDHPEAKILLMIHYPPRWKREDTPTAFEAIIAKYPVELLVYGHIHGVDLPMAYNEVMDLGTRSVRYENGSVDRTLMNPIQVLNLPGLNLPF